MLSFLRIIDTMIAAQDNWMKGPRGMDNDGDDNDREEGTEHL
ncbi:hypothetical protein KDA_20210 [Dictyobacter alpinus]|uniref:Uncharacterized protein n=1 Tax=Dictyobacter alpinus TaxID=2014873 RepID=A0A402B5A5_9CHLR|nr:hypothetical protein KDA_20210 [Dictyobacter alpinus]